jgi:riboflavin synthase
MRGNVFTGIVEELGEVVRLDPGRQSARQSVRGPLVTSDAADADRPSRSAGCASPWWNWPRTCSPPT